MINKLCAIYFIINLNCALSFILNPKLSRLGVEESLFFWNPFYFNYFNTPVPNRPLEQINLVKVLFNPKFGPDYQPVPPSLPSFVSPFAYPWINHQPNYKTNYQHNFEPDYQPYASQPLIFDQSINSVSEDAFSTGHNEQDQAVKDIDPDVMKFINQLDLDRIVEELEYIYPSMEPNLGFQGLPGENFDLGNVENNRDYNDPFWKENDKEGKTGFNNFQENDDNFDKFLDEDDAEENNFDSEKDKLHADQGYGGYENDDNYDPFFDSDKSSESDKTSGHQEMYFNPANDRINFGNSFAYYGNKEQQGYLKDTKFQTNHHNINGLVDTPDDKNEKLVTSLHYNPANPIINPSVNSLPDWRPYFDYPEKFLLQLYQNRKAKGLTEESKESTEQVDQNMPKEVNQTTTIAPTY